MMTNVILVGMQNNTTTILLCLSEKIALTNSVVVNYNKRTLYKVIHQRLDYEHQIQDHHHLKVCMTIIIDNFSKTIIVLDTIFRSTVIHFKSVKTSSQSPTTNIYVDRYIIYIR